MTKLIIFDLDDTLYAENDYVKSGFRAVANYLSNRKKIKNKDLYEFLLESFKEKGRGKNFDYIIKKYDWADITVAELVNIYRGHTPLIKLYPEAVELLDNLSKKFKLSLLTNGWVDVQKRKIKSLGINKYFDSIFLSQKDGLEFRKPHKRFFLKVLERHSIKPEDALMVGDDPVADFEGANSLGIKTYLVSRPTDLKKISKIFSDYLS